LGPGSRGTNEDGEEEEEEEEDEEEEEEEGKAAPLRSGGDADGNGANKATAFTHVVWRVPFSLSTCPPRPVRLPFQQMGLWAGQETKPLTLLPPTIPTVSVVVL
jgi:hypothetical protein